MNNKYITIAVRGKNPDGLGPKHRIFRILDSMPDFEALEVLEPDPEERSDDLWKYDFYRADGDYIAVKTEEGRASESGRWYAVMRDRDDDDWGYGSYILETAKNMARSIGPNAYIAVIIDSVCVEEIEIDD